MEMQRYPLCWPAGWKRTSESERKHARFKSGEQQYRVEANGNRVPSYMRKRELSVYDATQRIQYELERLGVRDGDAVINTNIPTRLDGLPRSGAKEPDDPGVAVYWELKGKRECMAIDRYTSVAGNLAALAATLEAMRAIERHGGAEILERAFTGFAALPEAAGGKAWREILGFDSHPHTKEAVKARFLALAKERHPDAGGDEASFRELIWARDQALQEAL